MDDVQKFANDALTLILVGSGLLMAVGFAVNFLAEQALLLTGNSLGLSRMWVRVVGMVVGFLLVLFAPTITSWVISALSSMGL